MLRSDRRAVFVGVARDCAHYLPEVLANLGRFACAYSESSFLFVVSDSLDDSQSLLQRWLSCGRRGSVVALGQLAGTLPKRTERLAYVRNIALDYLLRCQWSNYDHLVVVDLDDVLSQPVEYRAFALASEWLAADPGRAAVFANAMPRYYDIWALRHDRWCPGDCWHSIWYRGDGQEFESAKFKEVIARQVRIPINAPPIEVRSAFGGLAIYRLPVARDARYRGIDSSGRETSEHVAFNEQIAAGGRLFIYPPLRVHAPLEHLYKPSEFRLCWRLAFQWERIADFLQPRWRKF